MPTCFPRFAGVPGSLANSLDWWTGFTPGNRDSRFFPDDPDWFNNFLISHGSGTTEHVTFRGLCSATHLYLSWVVRVAPALPAGTGTVPFPEQRSGLDFLIGDGTNFVAVRLRLQNLSAKDSSDNFIRDVHTYSLASGLSTNQLMPDPAWMTSTARIWQDYNTPRSSTTIPWAIQVAVPFNVNLTPGAATSLTIAPNTSFKFWYNVRLYSAGGVVAKPFPGTASATHDVNIIPAGFTGIDAQADLSGAAVCAGSDGVRLSGAQIGIRDGTGALTNQIQVDLVNPTPDTSLPEHQNRFYVAPDISRIGAGNPANIRATFSIAPWGSQEILMPNSAWKPIPKGTDVRYDVGANEAWFVFPDANTPAVDPAGWAWLQTFVTGVKQWYASSGASGLHPHRCVLVELTSTSGDITFAVSSSYNNFRFVNASTFTEIAEISVEGLRPISVRPRDVYLYLQTLKMPRVVDQRDEPRRSMMRAGGIYVRDDNNPIDTYEELIEYLPSYQVHAYHDTGLKMRYEDGSEVPILEAQTSFGYLVNHEGSLVGWETRLYGAEKIVENFYVVRVPNNGTVKVTTALQARESNDEAPLAPEPDITLPDPGPPWLPPGCWLVIQSLFRFIAVLIKPLNRP